MEETRKGLWLFGFESPKEARRILRKGTRRLGASQYPLGNEEENVGCNVGGDAGKTMWVRLLGLPLHLWSRPVLKRISDRCGGFIVADENTTFMSDLCWARIRVNWDGSSNSPFVVVFE